MSQHPITRYFASDNYSGVHPAIMQALIDANVGHVPAYGEDVFTAKLDGLITKLFGAQAVGFPVFNGTGANVLGLQSMTPRWGAVICAASAHIHQDESNAPQAMGGLKLWVIDTPDGKLSPKLIAKEAHGFGNEHRSQPAVVYISQATEYGTVYRCDEIRAIADMAHSLGMKLFVDGARLSNAAVSLGVDFKTMISDTGVDMVSLGGTKNGMMFGECLIDVRGQYADTLKYLRKMNMQTASKMRFISAQLVRLLSDDLYLGIAAHANQMAVVLAEKLKQINGVDILYRVEANAIFAKLPAGVADQVREKYSFYDWDNAGTVRLMCSFDTTVADIDDMAEMIKAAIAK